MVKIQMNQISLDINKSGQIINEPVVLRAGEKDQSITVNLLKDGQPYTSFTTATFFANKPSGAIVANDPANISNGVITYTVPQALVNEFGKITNAYFLIDGKVSTENFVIAVLQGVRVSDDLGDLIPGMGNLNVIYDKWKAKLDSIDRELQGIDAPKEVKNVIDNELKNYTDQINELQGRITAAETQLNALEVPVNAVGTNLLLKTYAPFSMTGSNIKAQFKQMYALSRRLEKGTKVTLSFDAVSTALATFCIQNIGSTSGGTWMAYIVSTVDTTKKHYAATITLDGFSDIGVRMLLDNVPSTTTITVSNIKLELGSYATDYSLNPEDISTSDDVTEQIKANQPDLSGFQTQAIFKTGDYKLNTCPQGTDFGEFLKSDSVPKGFSIIRDGNPDSYMNWRIIKEDSNFIYGLAQDMGATVYHLEVLGGVYKGYKKVISNLIGRTITATDDTGKTVNLNVTGIS